MPKETKYYHKFTGLVAFIRTEFIGYWQERTYDKRTNELTYKDSQGFSWERTYDEFRNELTYKDSSGTTRERTYDESGNPLTYKDSEGYYSIKGTPVTKAAFEAFINKPARPCVGKKVMVDGVEYELK